MTKLSVVVFWPISCTAKQRLLAGLSFPWKLRIINQQYASYFPGEQIDFEESTTANNVSNALLYNMTR